MSELIASTYEIVKEIGSGGGGVVYLANHLRLEKKVILKADKRRITTRLDLLRREVDILKELSHEYVPQVYDFFVENEIVYTVIDYIDGESLDKPLKRGEKFSQIQVIKWAVQILEALNYLHSPIHGDPPKGYVHSDIKPANIMKKSNGDICLIDFNIALALGEENAIGCSRGYASPEHYGLDFSSDGNTGTDRGTNEGSGTEILPMARIRKLNSRSGTSSLRSASSEWTVRKMVVPDVRSDIYSLGATLYHLLSGKRPEKDAREVIPLSKKEFSPQIVDIITKAMNPNPDLRYQSAEEMLYAFTHLYQNDIRMIRWKRRNKFAYTSISFLLILGTVSSFIGLKRIQTTERWLRITDEAENIFQAGDAMQALEHVMQVYSEEKNLLTPETPVRTQNALTEVLGVYDLADDFDLFRTVELPSAPLDLEISPDAASAAAICMGQLVIIDPETADIEAQFPAETSALAEVKYLDANTLVYAGAEGITAYDVENKKVLWTGEHVTGITVSADGTSVAGVYKDDEYAVIYDAVSGQLLHRVNFDGRHQSVEVNDTYINPAHNLFCLNNDGSRLAVSFSDGSLKVFSLTEESGNGSFGIFESDSGYDHFEGGFYKQYLALAVTDYSLGESAVAVIDTDTVEQAGGFGGEGYYFTSADENGIYVGIDNIFVQLDPESGEQKALVDTTERIEQYSYDNTYTMISSGGQVCIFDQNAEEICSFKRDVQCNRLEIQNGTAMIGSSDSPVLWIVKHEDHANAEIAVYDSSYSHDETRISSDRKNMMLFSYDRFRICDLEGDLIADVSIPDADEVYDQKYIREGTASWLEVIYNDGQTDRYDASTGKLLESKKGEQPDLTLYEEFETAALRIESPLHGTPKVYDKESGKLIAELSDDAYLTYITEIGDYIVAQYVTRDKKHYGYLMNQNCEILAYLPELCDILADTFLFDYRSSGCIREAKLYELSDLQALACEKIQGGKINES